MIGDDFDVKIENKLNPRYIETNFIVDCDHPNFFINTYLNRAYILVIFKN